MKFMDLFVPDKALSFVIGVLIVIVCCAYGDRGENGYDANKVDGRKCSHPISKEEEVGAVLMYLPIAAYSHVNPFVAIAKGLAEKGYFITIVHAKLSNELTDIDGNDRIQQIDVDIDFTPIYKNYKPSPERVAATDYKHLKFIWENIKKTHRDALTHPGMKHIMDLINASTVSKIDIRQRFDVVFVASVFNEVGYFLADKLNAPLILLNSVNINMFLTLELGYFDNPAFVTTTWHRANQTCTPGFFNRLGTFLFQCFFLTLKQYLFVSQQEQLLQDLNLNAGQPVHLLSMEREAALGMYMHHFIFDAVRPTLPNTIDIGFIHCRPAKPLNHELRTQIERYNTSVIYMSFGSHFVSDVLDPDMLLAFKKTFERLPYQVVVRSEARLFDLPNVITCNWCPQQDVLGHPKTVLFISHAGLHSTEEAIYHKVPIIAVPLSADQFANGERAERRGYGKIWRHLEHPDVETMADALHTMIVDIVENNSSYKVSIEEQRTIVMDSQMETPLERALFWTEYVIKHPKAPMLKSPSRDISYIKLLYFDMYAFLTCLTGVLAFIAYKCIMLIKRKFVFIIKQRFLRRQEINKQD